MSDTFKSIDFDVGGAPDNYNPEDEERIRREYKNTDAIDVPDIVTKKDGLRFVIARFLEVDERGGLIGISPLVYRSKAAEDGDKTVVLASHALQTEEGVARILATLRADYCGGDTDEAVEIVDAAKRALGMEAEEAILELRAEREPARLLMQKHAERTEELKKLAGEKATKQLPAKGKDAK